MEDMEYWQIRICDMERRIADHKEDGLIYEDELVIVNRVNGAVEMTGKPLKDVFIYEGTK